MQSRIAPTSEAGAATLEAARGVFDQLDRGAAKAEADRRLPPETVEAMRAAHAFRMPMPAAWGGPELPIGDMLLVLEELAYADGSAGWCAMIGCDSGFYAAKLEDALDSYVGTVVAVTHDRWFLRGFDRFLVFGRDAAVTEHLEPVFT